MRFPVAVLAAVAVVAAVLFEAVLARRSGRAVYTRAGAETDCGIAFGFLVVAPLTAALTSAVIAFGYRYRIADFGDSWAAIAAMFLVADFLYYLWHRASHRWRWLWATHVVHHTAERVNFLMSFRQGWTDPVSGTWLFFAPLGLLGFGPANAGLYFAALFGWQFWVHNEWASKLGLLEWLLVTPSNHRVHHALEVSDRNFGGVFIIWDRLFGTFHDEGSVPVVEFGIAGLSGTDTPWASVVVVWKTFFARKRTAPEHPPVDQPAS